MNYSICLKCRELAKGDVKYCPECQEEFGLPDILGRLLKHFKEYKNFDNWAKKEMEKDLKDSK